jgi:ribosome-associated heat shock protein Hsp15
MRPAVVEPGGNAYDGAPMAGTGRERVRLDKWLWAARFYKTRSQASLAIKGGKVSIAGSRAKPSQPVAVGNHINVRKGPYDFAVGVLALAERRGSAERARALYSENPDSVRAREEVHDRIVAERKAAPRYHPGQGRPTKKQRRALIAFKEQYLSPEEIEEDDL